MGSPKPVETNLRGAVLEVELDDGCTVQMSVGEDGKVAVRAWGNVPGKVANMDQASAYFLLMPEVQTTCPVCYGPIGECECQMNVR